MSGQPRQLRLSSRLVVAVLLAVSGLALIVGVALIGAHGERLIRHRQEAVARSARDYFVAFAHAEGMAPLARALDRAEVASPHKGFRYAVFSADGRRLGGADLLTADQLPALGARDHRTVDLGEKGAWDVWVQPLSMGGQLVLYQDLDETADFRSTILTGSAAALAAAIAAVVAASLWLNRLLLARAESITATAARIAQGEFSARAAADPRGDVFDRMGVSINAMLDRNEELMTGMRTVTDSLAHDLRSPLTRLSAALSRALEADPDEPGRDEALEAAWREAEGALAVTSAMLDVARAEAGISREAFERVDLRAVAMEMAELFGPILEDAGQTLTVDDGAPVIIEGHDVLLRQALGNLLHNAASHAGAGAAVAVGLDARGDRVRLVVADTGPGIPAESRGRVQERFVRLDEARAGSGSGLGLAIVAACAKLHGGALSLEDNRPGLRAVVELRRKA